MAGETQEGYQSHNLSPLETLPRSPDSSLSPHFSLIIIIPPSFGLRTVVHLSDMMPKPRASEGGRERRQLPLASPSLHLRHAWREREREARVAREVLLSLSLSLVHVRPRVRVRPCRAHNKDFPEVANKRAIKCVISVARD